jgi:uncharacterized glyoxalase superfamily protein PhnB
MSAMTDASRPAVVAVVSYRDPIAAMRWLETAFGFETTTLVTDADGRVAFAEMSFVGAPLQVMGEWESDVLLGPARVRSPLSLEGVVTHFFRVTVPDLDAHCERARAAGARVTQEPKDQFYGERTYRALDLEGHVWNFSQPVEQVSPEEIERRSNLTIRKGRGG